MSIEIDFSPQAERWYAGLPPLPRAAVKHAIGQLSEQGDQLRPPLAKAIKTSRHCEMRELRPNAGNLRVLFAIDPNGRAQLLIGGDKTNRWRSWYRENVSRADRLFDNHLRSIGRGHAWHATRVGARSTARTR